MTIGRPVSILGGAVDYFDSAAELLMQWQPRTQQEARAKLTTELQLSLCRNAIMTAIAALARLPSPQPEPQLTLLQGGLGDGAGPDGDAA